MSIQIHRVQLQSLKCSIERSYQPMISCYIFFSLLILRHCQEPYWSTQYFTKGTKQKLAKRKFTDMQTEYFNGKQLKIFKQCHNINTSRPIRTKNDSTPRSQPASLPAGRRDLSWRGEPREGLNYRRKVVQYTNFLIGLKAHVNSKGKWWSSDHWE